MVQVSHVATINDGREDDTTVDIQPGRVTHFRAKTSECYFGLGVPGTDFVNDVQIARHSP